MFEYLFSFSSTEKGRRKERERERERERRKIRSRKSARACTSWGFFRCVVTASFCGIYTRARGVKRDMFSRASRGCVFFFSKFFFGLRIRTSALLLLCASTPKRSYSDSTIDVKMSACAVYSASVGSGHPFSRK